MPKNNLFQTILITVFIVGAVFAVMIFAGIINIGGKPQGAAAVSGTVTIWGTLPKEKLVPLTQEFHTAYTNLSLVYEEHDSNTFESDLIEALAAGKGPDLVFLPDNAVLHLSDKLFHVPFTNYPELNFRQTYVTEGDLFLAKDGVLGFPAVLDPLVMYYNTDVLDSAGIANPPKNWTELSTMIPSLVQKNTNTNTIARSAIALGEYVNVENAQSIFAALLLQSGDQIVGPVRDSYGSVLKNPTPLGDTVAETITSFYTQFADPVNELYSWHRALPNSRDQFIRGKLAIYFGFGSELDAIRAANPNMRFDVAQFPQIKDYPTSVTFGRINALAVMKNSQNIPAAYTVATLLTNSTYDMKLSSIFSLPPTRRDLLNTKPSESGLSYLSTFYNSALIARGWLDPDSSKSESIFKTLIEGALSGQKISLLVAQADGQLNQLVAQAIYK